MKHLLTLTALLISSLAMGQFPNLPYNPDDNADGLIGVADLQALLANYGSEFASAVVSEDGESAIVYMGAMDYFSCDYSCTQLPGMWQLPNARDLVPVYNILNAGASTYTWVNRDDFVEMLSLNNFPCYRGNSVSTARDISYGEPNSTFSCYCAAKQLPRVEYTVSARTDFETFKDECRDFVNDGWVPLPGGITRSGSNNYFSQAFWRWAE